MVGVFALCFSISMHAQGGRGDEASEDARQKRVSSFQQRTNGSRLKVSNFEFDERELKLPTWSDDLEERKSQKAAWIRQQQEEFEEMQRKADSIMHPTNPEIIKMRREAREGAIRSHFLIPDGRGGYMPNPAVFGDRSWVTAGRGNHVASH